ncbi:MAG: pilus assembly protein PilM [Lentisphaerae bacterium]|nr:pilus assembly protein PilM [Lentisphaerota bacterium]
MSTDRTKHGSVVLVEIGNDWLKVIQVDRGATGLALVKVDLEKLDPIKSASPDLLSRILRKYPSGSVYGCLPRQLATVRMLDLPSTDPLEIGDMVELQAGKLTPYSKEEIVADYKIVGPSRDGYTKVMLVIVQRSVLRNRFSVMEEAGIPLATMSIGTEGVLNWMRKAFPSGNGRGAVAVLDVDAAFSDFMVIAQDRLLFTRSILVGAATLAADEGARDRIVKEVSNALQTFASENSGVKVERLLVSGAGINVPGLSPLLSERQNLPVEPVDGLQIFRKTPSQPALHQAPYDAVSLTPLIGMAIDLDRLEFRLVPESVKLRKELVQKARSLTVLGCLIISTLVLLSMWGTLRYFFKRAQLADIRQDVSAKADEVRAINQKLRLVEVVQQRSDPRLALFNILSELRQALPEPMQIMVDTVEFDGERGTLQVSGTGASAGDIGSLVQSLEKSALLADVREDGSTTRESSGRFRFRVLCRLEEVPDAG